jgi:chemotaxis-related protein WspD
MNRGADIRQDSTHSLVNDCWNTIGVRGNASCPELQKHVHCRNCPAYSSGAVELLDRDLPANYLADWTHHFAQPKYTDGVDTQSIVIFRVGGEWLALSTVVVSEVANRLPIHSLPHRMSRVVIGVANVRGQLLICVSLAAVLGLESNIDRDGENPRAVYARLLVCRCASVRIVCPIDQVHGIHRFHARELREVPSTVAKAKTTYSRALLPWNKQSVGVLDDQLLFSTIERSMA